MNNIEQSINVRKTAAKPIQRRWWLRTRPVSNGIQLGLQNVPAAIEFYVPWWGWPFEILHRCIFGYPKLNKI